MAAQEERFVAEQIDAPQAIVQMPRPPILACAVRLRFTMGSGTFYNLIKLQRYGACKTPSTSAHQILLNTPPRSRSLTSDGNKLRTRRLTQGSIGGHIIWL